MVYPVFHPLLEEGVSALLQSICGDEDVLFRWTFIGIEYEPRVVRTCCEVMDNCPGLCFIKSLDGRLQRNNSSNNPKKEKSTQAVKKSD